MSYTYPPSKHVLQYGDIEENSHFFCEGVAFIDDYRIGKTKCFFEVAYLQSAQIIVVCYFSSSNYWVEPKHYYNCSKIIGRDIKSGLLVVAEGLYARGYHQENLPSEKASVKFNARCFRTFIPPNKKIEHEDEFSVNYSVSSIDFPQWLDQKSKYADDDARGRIVFPLNEKNKLILLAVRTPEQKLYDNHWTGRLSVYIEPMPDGWTDIDIVDFWCAIMSLALGRDIQFTSFLKPLPFKKYRYSTWQARHLNGAGEFTPVIARFGLGSRQDVNILVNYVQQMFSGVLDGRISCSSAHNYTHIIRQYVNYRIISTTTGEGRARLIATLTEELLHWWERANNLKPENLISRSERTELEKIIKNTMTERAEDYLNTENLTNRDRIIERVIDLIHRNIRDVTLVERFRYLFASYEHSLGSNKLGKRIRAFKDTRDSIAHVGLFSHANPEYNHERLVQFCSQEEHRLQHEYENTLMMIPLMIFTIFGYSGKYIDLLQDKKAYW